MNSLAQLMSVFALTEQEQEAYFPVWESAVWINFGVYDTETRFARFAALCALADACKRGETQEGEAGQLCSEICSLANLLIESSAVWEWLLWHPRTVRTPEQWTMIAPDPTIYGVWSVLRRLCREASQLISTAGTLPPFDQVFSGVIDLPKGS